MNPTKKGAAHGKPKIRAPPRALPRWGKILMNVPGDPASEIDRK
jgi:hypothetical protein